MVKFIFTSKFNKWGDFVLFFLLECKDFAVNNWHLGHKYQVPTLEIFCQAIIAAVFGWCLFVGLSVFILLLQHKSNPVPLAALCYSCTRESDQIIVTMCNELVAFELVVSKMETRSATVQSVGVFKIMLVCRDGSKMAIARSQCAISLGHNSQ